jgi:hypothetical protein
VAQIFLALAALAALYDSKILVWDIAVADLRAGSGGWGTVIFAIIVSAAFIALPTLIGVRFVLAGRSTAALLVALGSLALSALGFVVLSAAFTP